MRDAARLDPDVAVVSGIESGETLRAIAGHLDAGHGLLGTTDARDSTVFLERALARGVAPSVIREIDLVIVTRRVDGDLVVDGAIEVVDAAGLSAGGERAGVVDERRGIGWNALAWRTDDGLAVHDGLADANAGGDRAVHTLEGIAAATDRRVATVCAEYWRKHRYLQYLVREGVDGADDLFDLLADLSTNEAATVERLDRRSREQGDGFARTPGVDN